ncbi:MAG: GHKL domain-containing protein [Spirochaetales bacterium]|nr:GHKL domain-containing protein [Spirochaetales bacterium]
MVRKFIRFLNKISVRILLLNILLVFVPIAAILLLETYEKQLLASLEHALAQQGRMLAGALSDSGPLTEDRAGEIIRKLKQEHEARIRIVDTEGKILADSSSYKTQEVAPVTEKRKYLPSSEPASYQKVRKAKDSFLYKAASWPVRVFRKYFLPPPRQPMESSSFYTNTDSLMGDEIREALAGRYGAVTRISTSEQVSVTLYSALPVTNNETVVGAVLVSQSTFRILQDLYILRLNIIKIFAVSLLLAFFISFVLAYTISRPLRHLRRQALQALDKRGRLITNIEPGKFKDEIGDLSNALYTLTSQVSRHTAFIESFSSDISHEFKNPLASIRSAGEMLAEAESKGERDKFLVMIQKDVQRMEHLITDLREISTLDSTSEETLREKINIPSFLNGHLPAVRKKASDRNVFITVHFVSPDICLAIPEFRLYQLFDNLLGNAISYSPEKGTVSVDITTENRNIIITITDQGPGIPDDMKDSIFDRFFSTRKDEERHSGLGLSIVRAIMDNLNGSIRVENNQPTGAVFILVFPQSC